MLLKNTRSSSQLLLPLPQSAYGAIDLPPFEQRQSSCSLALLRAFRTNNSSRSSFLAQPIAEQDEAIMAGNNGDILRPEKYAQK